MYRILFLFLLFTTKIIAQIDTNNLDHNLALKNYNIVTIKDSTSIEIAKFDKFYFKNNTSTLVNKNCEEANQINFFYFTYNKELKVNNILITITDLHGKVIKKLKMGDFEDISAFTSFTIYTDQRAKFYRYIPTEFPYIINYSIEYSSNMSAFIPNFDVYETDNTYIINRKFHIINKSDAKIRYRKIDLDGIDLKEVISQNEYYFEMNNIQPKVQEEYSIYSDPKITFSLDHFSIYGVEGTFNNWTQFGDWYIEKLLFDTQEVDEKVRNDIKQLIGNEKDKKKISQIIYNYVQQKTRYISVQKGIKGWKPMKAMEVDKYGYGDCKALANYTKTLLDVAGVESNLIIINASLTKSSIDKDFASLTGNHIILNIPFENDTVWLECTSQDIAYNQITTHTHDRDALLICKNGSKIVHTPKLNFETNKHEFNTSIEVLSDNKINVQINSISKGFFYLESFNQIGLPNNEIDKMIKNDLKSFQEISNLQYKIDNDKTNGIFSSKIEFNASNFCKKIGKDLLIKAIPFENFSTNLKKNNNRLTDLEIVGKSMNHIITYRIPDDYYIKELPKNIEKQSDFGNYSMNFIQESNKLIVNRRIDLFDIKTSKERYIEFVDFLEEMSKFDNKKIILTALK